MKLQHCKIGVMRRAISITSIKLFYYCAAGSFGAFFLVSKQLELPIKVTSFA